MLNRIKFAATLSLCAATVGCYTGTPLEIDGCITFDGERYVCDSVPAQARCWAHLYSDEIVACTYLEQPELDAVRATRDEVAALYSTCTAENSALGTVFRCTGLALESCMKYQRGGSLIHCVNTASGVNEFEPAARHEATLLVDFSDPDAVTATSETRGRVAMSFNVPPAPTPRGNCNPANPIGSCSRSCDQLVFKNEPHPNFLGIFAIGPAHACNYPITEFTYGDGDYAFEGELCRETAALNGVTSGVFQVNTVKAIQVTGKFCFNDPVTTQNGGTWTWTNQCAWVDRPVVAMTRFVLTCDVRE